MSKALRRRKRHRIIRKRDRIRCFHDCCDSSDLPGQVELSTYQGRGIEPRKKCR